MRPFLFDIDGTLVDSTNVVTAVWAQVAAQFGADVCAILPVCHGRRDEDVVEEFFDSRLAPVVLREIARLELQRANEVREVSGASALLGALQPTRWAAVTSGSRTLMTARLEGAGLPVPRVLVTGENVRRGKPDPEGYLIAAHALTAAPAECVVVEDSPAGVAAGKAAGSFVVGVTTTHQRSALTDADIVIDELAELTMIVPDL